MIAKLFFLAIAVALLGCGVDPASGIPAAYHGEIKIEQLFTHDGITVYRFYDHGHAVYFTKRGSTYQAYLKSTGKGAYLKHVQVLSEE